MHILNTKNIISLVVSILVAMILFLPQFAKAASVFFAVDGDSYTEVEAGENIRFSYEVTGLSNCSVNNGVGSINNADLPSGYIDISAPASASTVYTLSCGGMQDTALVKVKPEVNLSVNNPVVTLGGSPSTNVELSWTTSLANSCDTLYKVGVDGDFTDISFSGLANDSQTVSVSENSTFFLTCVSSNGLRTTDSVEVEVTDVPLPAPEINVFSVANNNLELNGLSGRTGTRVTWDTKNADQCTRSAENLSGGVIVVDNWSGGNVGKVEGSYFVSLTESAVLILDCGRSSDGQFTQLSRTVNVTNPVGGLLSPTANITTETPVSLDYADGGFASSLVSTSITGVDSCTYSATKVSNGSSVNIDGWTNRVTTGAFDGSYTIKITESVNLSLSCVRLADNAVVTDSEAVIVSAPAGPAVTLSASSASVTSDSSGIAYTNLTWSGTNVTSCPVFEAVADNGTRYIYNSDTAVSGSLSVPVYMDTTFNILCDRVSDTQTAQDSVSVNFSGVDAPSANTISATECYDMSSGSVITIPSGASADSDNFCRYNYESTGDDGGGGIILRSYTPPCVFSPAPGRTIVDFSIHPSRTGNNILTAPIAGWQWYKTLPTAVSLPAGEYVVRSYVRDAYYDGGSSDRANSPAYEQEHEMTQVRFYSSTPNNHPSAENDIVRSSYSPDLQDGVREAEFIGITDSALVLPNNVNYVQSWHIGATNPTLSVSSVRPVCAAFDSALPVITLEVRNDTVGGPYQEVGQITIEPGEDVSIRWDVEGADTCTAVAGSGFSVGGSVSDEDNDITEPISGDSELYTIRCENANGSVSDSVLVNAGQVFGTVKLEVEKEVVQRGERVEVVWEIDPRLEPLCSINTEGLVGTVDFSTGSGNLTTTPIMSEREYLLDCGLGGSDSARIKVVPEISEF